MDECILQRLQASNYFSSETPCSNIRALTPGHAQSMTVHLHVLALTDILVHDVKVNI